MGVSLFESWGRTAERPRPPHLKTVGDAAPREFVLAWYTTSVGTEADNVVQIVHPSISPHHARIVRRRLGRYFISDLESATGTFVNGRRVARTKRIKSGDAIQFGDVRLVFIDTMSRYRDKASRLRGAWAFVVILLSLLVGWEFDRIDRYLGQLAQTTPKQGMAGPRASMRNATPVATPSATPAPSSQGPPGGATGGAP